MIKLPALIRAYVFSGLALACVFFYPEISTGQQAVEFKDSDRAAIEKLFDGYGRTFSTKDYAGLRDYLQAPFALFAAGWEVKETLDDVMTYYRNLRDALDKDNYDHSSLIRSKMTVLSADRVLVDIVYRRYRKDGSLLLEAAGVYVVSKSSGTWKICGIFRRDVKDFGKEYSSK